MATDLSCNWKKLQASSKYKSTIISSRKRYKYITDTHQKYTTAMRQKLDSKLSKNSNLIKSSTADGTSCNRPDMAQEITAKSISNSSPVKSLQLWAWQNEISASDLAEAYGENFVNDTKIITDVTNGGLQENVTVGRYVALDCEMVGVGKKDRSVLARVSIVNYHGYQIYDSFVKTKEFVTNWRTPISGITAREMRTARDFKEVQEEIASILKDRIVIGHSLGNDFRAMQLSHPKRNTRDTSLLSEFRKFSNNRTPSLKLLAQKVLGVDIQCGEHSSLEDARAAMLLYRRYKHAFDAEFPSPKTKIMPESKSRSKTKINRKQ